MLIIRGDIVVRVFCIVIARADNYLPQIGKRKGENTAFLLPRFNEQKASFSRRFRKVSLAIRTFFLPRPDKFILFDLSLPISLSPSSLSLLPPAIRPYPLSVGVGEVERKTFIVPGPRKQPAKGRAGISGH